MKTTHFNSNSHIDSLINDDYYKKLIFLRSKIEISCDEYFQKLNAPKVDLFLISQGVSSPMGKGSDSLPIPIKFGKDDVFLVDSAQFGMEPLVQKAFKMVYCYLPSFRGEDADDRHLNQFYHCEAELRGTIDDVINVVEGLITHIFKSIKDLNDLDIIKNIIKSSTKKFPRITFDEAAVLLQKLDSKRYIVNKKYGRIINNEGEQKIAEIVGKNLTPIWITEYDRNVVPFYQKPSPTNSKKVINADLIFPVINGSFGGEVVGCGQRQDRIDELEESIKSQEIKNSSTYQWYINLRKSESYSITSGFGLGIERLLAWIMGEQSIIDVSLYPVIKNNKSVY